MYTTIADFSCDCDSTIVGRSLLVHSDCRDWLAGLPEDMIHAVVTDPPYGVKEYEVDQLDKRSSGKGGIWRIPPSFDGNRRAPLPRFTALDERERVVLRRFFKEWAVLVLRVLRPGGHIFLASNALLAQEVFTQITEAGFEYRGNVIRLVRTLRGGDRPKNAEERYPDVCSMPRGCYEPWGIFRKPLPSGWTVSDCLDQYETGGLRRKPDGNPFEDVITSERTPKREKALAGHPSLKPQSFLRQLVYASLPLGKGILLDPFMGSGSTVAAAEGIGYQCIGVERHWEYYNLAVGAVSRLAWREHQQQSLPLLSR